MRLVSSKADDPALAAAAWAARVDLAAAFSGKGPALADS